MLMFANDIMLPKIFCHLRNNYFFHNLADNTCEGHRPVVSTLGR